MESNSNIEETGFSAKLSTLSDRRLFPVYRRCRVCQGIGYIERMGDIMTTAGWQSFNYTCVKCDGTGKEETEYFIEL